ncbi:MAG: type II toxin-antitoxin system VapC family toxin [Candidatus Eremiobacteraeota bacterium]|nr:type II toxin-antitoxin system VapC family toxin [Candidatus Eremiobacteraeota bacterium]
MGYLLDTHILLWSLREPERLGPKARKLLGNSKSELWLSPISLWECLVLANKGRLKLLPDAQTWGKNLLSTSPLREARLSFEVALRSREVTLGHEDPADRFLAATASVYDLTLITADTKLLEGDGFKVLAND